MKFGIGLLLALAAAGPALSRKTCVVHSGGAVDHDDAPAIIKAFRDCKRGGRVLFLPNKYYINSILDIQGLEDVHIDIHGELLVWHSSSFRRGQLTLHDLP
jgi:hypothetical protein